MVEQLRIRPRVPRIGTGDTVDPPCPGTTWHSTSIWGEGGAGGPAVNPCSAQPILPLALGAFD